MTVIALSGGVGGAKLVLGLYRALPAHSLTVIVNTGDDFDYLGLRICPDLDTVLYTLAEVAHLEQGWGRRDESWTMMRVLESLGEDPWFRLGDADTALHLVRSKLLREGRSLTEVIKHIGACMNIHASILPMTDSVVETRVLTDVGELSFQDYFVRRRCEPTVRSIHFARAASAQPAPGVVEALQSDSLQAIVLCPSNPYLSIDPMLAVPGLRAALERRRVPLVAICPLIDGRAVKGPTAKIMGELDIQPTAQSIAAHYGDLIDGFIIDSADIDQQPHIRKPTFVTRTLMSSLDDRMQLARFVLDCAQKIDSLRGD